MKLFFKRAGFLALMAILGVLSILFQSSGYPVAWKLSSVRSDQAYWLPISYAIDLLCIASVVGFVFWVLRRFLFGRGKPYLAWFSIGVWILVWCGLAWHDVSDRSAFWTYKLVVGNDDLNEKVADLSLQEESIAEIKSLPDDQRKLICSNAILEEETRIAIKREGYPVEIYFSKYVAGKGLFDADACPTELVTQFRKMKGLQEKIAHILSEVGSGEVNQLRGAAAQLRLTAHPDAIVRMSDIYKTFKESPIEREIALKETTLRIYTNGQVREPQWKEMSDLANDKFKSISIDPRIWNESDKDDADEWNFWIKVVKTNGSSYLALFSGDCQKRTLKTQIEIQTRADGAVRLLPIQDDTTRVVSDSRGDDFLQIACASKDQQARIPDDLKSKKFGE